VSDISIVLNVELSDEQAQALAQFLKGLTWTDIRPRALSTEETYLVNDAIRFVRRELSAHGY